MRARWFPRVCFWLAAVGACAFRLWTAMASGGELPAIVFIHGIKGSVLRDAEDNTRWLTAWQALGLTSPSLELPLAWETDGRQARDGLTPAAILSRVHLIPGIASADIYGKFIDALPPGSELFAYDWRRDNFESADLFERFLGEVRAKHGGRRLVVVAHSNGGLIAWVVLNRHPDWFARLCFAGVPFAGGVGFLPDLVTGTANGLNRRILRPEVLGTFPSVYTFFKNPGPALPEIDFFSPATWQREKWGLFHSEQPAREKAESVAFLTTTLARAAAFRALLVKSAVAYPPLDVLRSRTTPTLRAIRRAAGGGIDFQAAPKCAGDGRVCAEDALPPGGVPVTVHEVDADHSDLLGAAGVPSWLRATD